MKNKTGRSMGELFQNTETYVDKKQRLLAIAGECA